jgi:hypothetical protein
LLREINNKHKKLIIRIKETKIIGKKLHEKRSGEVLSVGVCNYK